MRWPGCLGKETRAGYEPTGAETRCILAPDQRGSTVTTGVRVESVRRRRFRPSRNIVVVVLIVVCLLTVTGLVVGWRSWRNPGVFYTVPDSVSSGGAFAVGTPISWGMSYAHKGVDPPGVSIISATPNVLVNTANATIVVRVCTIDRSAGIGAIGSVHNLHTWCSRLAPPAGATMRLGNYADQLVVTVVSSRPGTVLVKGLHVTYSHGWKRGPEDIGEFVRLRAR